jgi:hypothetical protein
MVSALSGAKTNWGWKMKKTGVLAAGALATTAVPASAGEAPLYYNFFRSYEFSSSGQFECNDSGYGLWLAGRIENFYCDQGGDVWPTSWDLYVAWY